MRVTIFPWVGKEFIEVSGEAKAQLPGDAAVRELLGRFAAELKAHGLSLDDAVRTRLWARDRESRDFGSAERLKILTGKARSSSSSFIASGHFDSEANVAMDLWAMRPGSTAAQKTVQEYEPPRSPLRYMVYESMVFLSGVTSDAATLRGQLNSILPDIGQSLSDAGSSWRKAVRVSNFLKRGQSLDDLQTGLATALGSDLPKEMEYSFVDGYAGPASLVEIEVTAVV